MERQGGGTDEGLGEVAVSRVVVVVGARRRPRAQKPSCVGDERRLHRERPRDVDLRRRRVAGVVVRVVDRRRRPARDSLPQDTAQPVELGGRRGRPRRLGRRAAPIVVGVGPHDAPRPVPPRDLTCALGGAVVVDEGFRPARPREAGQPVERVDLVVDRGGPRLVELRPVRVLVVGVGARRRFLGRRLEPSEAVVAVGDRPARACLRLLATVGMVGVAKSAIVPVAVRLCTNASLPAGS